MVHLTNLTKPSVYRRILGGFALLIGLLVVASAGNYIKLVEVRTQTDQIIPTNLFTVALRTYAGAVAQLDNDLQRFFVVGGSDVREAIANDLAAMRQALASSPNNLLVPYRPSLDRLRLVTSQLDDELARLLGMIAGKTDALVMNTAIRDVVNLIDSAKQSEQQLSETILTDLNRFMLSEADAVNAALVILIGVTFIAVLLGIAVSLFVSRSIVEPLSEMTSAATQIAHGKLDVRVPVRSKDEPGQLAASFNSMTEQLQQSLQELQETIVSLQRSNVATAEAKEASRLKDEFLSVMSHELRTPLNAMIGFLGIMNMTGNLDEKNRHMVQRVRANAKRLLALINDVLDISRIEAGRLQLYPTEQAVDQLAEQIKSNMSILAEQKGLVFTVRIDDSVPATIVVDQDAIMKIITNLLSNAFKFTEQGEVSLLLQAQDRNLVIKVTDTGMGIPPHMYEVIFERFRQVDGSSTRQHGGSGLGLAIVQHLCKAMNGSVTVESILSKGSTFTAALQILSPQPVEGISEYEQPAIV